MPNKYYIDKDQNIRLVPVGKEEKFLSKYPGSREATRKELSDFENKRSGIKPNIKRERENESTAQKITFDKIPDYSSLIKDRKLSVGNRDNAINPILGNNSPFAKPSEDGIIADSMTKVRNNRRNDPDYIVDSIINEDRSYNDWIDKINKDTSISDNVRRELNEWYNLNFRDTFNSSDDVRIPSLVKEYLEKNKETVPDKIRIQGSSMFGGDTYVDGTKQINTPEQLRYIKDFLTNSPKGRAILKDEETYLNSLDNDINKLENDIQSAKDERKRLTPQSIGLLNYLRMSSNEKDVFNKRREDERAKIDQLYSYEDINSAENQLNELKKLRSAYKDGDKGAIKQLLNEFGRRLPYDLVNAGSLGTIGLTDQESLVSSLNNENNKLTRKGYDLVNEYQQTHQLDRSIAQDIAQGTSYMIPYIAQFASTGGIAHNTTKSVIDNVASKVGSSTLGKVATESAKQGLEAGLRTFLMPQTLADAYSNSIDNPGSFLNSYANAYVSNYVENLSEGLGEYIPGPKFKNKGLNKAMDITGIHSVTGEYAEEQLSTIMHSAIGDGQAQWSDLVDPRNQAVTLGTVALMQLPFVSVASGGYAAGKFRDIKTKRSIRRGYNRNLANMNSVFGKESESLMNTINNMVDNEMKDTSDIHSLLENISNDRELNDREKDALIKYSISYIPYSSLNQAKKEQIDGIGQQITQVVSKNVNPQMNSIILATIAGNEEPMHIVGGNIVLNEDGSIDKVKSDQEIYYNDIDGNRKVTSIKDLVGIDEMIPSEDAIDQLTEEATAPILAQQENEEVREYAPGEIVTADIYGNDVPFTGQITDISENGNYIVADPNTGQQVEVEPRRIINQDNIEGVENGSVVEYRSEDGEIRKGIINDAYGLRPQGMMDIDGNVVPIADIIGLVDKDIEEGNAVSENISTRQYVDSVNNIGQSEENQTNNLPYIERIPKNEAGDILFEQSPVETSIAALKEVYDDNQELSGVVDATIKSIVKQIEKAKQPKPTGNISKDIENKLIAKQQIEELNNRLVYWQDVKNAIKESKPIEQRVSEQLIGEQTPTIKLDNDKKPKIVNQNTPYQRRLNTIEPNVSTIRDRILYGIASGDYKFRWKDQGVSMGLARELGLSGSETERKARIGLLSNNGYTPSTLAHHIWEETGGELNDNDIRNQVIDVLNTISSRKQALEALENNTGVTEEQYQQQQLEASEYELKLRAEVESRYNEILSQLIEDDLVSLRDDAVSLGATLEQIEDVRTPSDFIDLIEQLQDEQQEQTSDRAGSNEEAKNVENEGNNNQRTQRAVSERNRSEEGSRDSRQDSDSRGDGINHSSEEKHVVVNATTEIDAEIAEAQKELASQQKELSSAKKRLAKAQAETQSNLFDSKHESTLFDIPTDLSKGNSVDNILTPIQQQIDAAQTNLDNLINSRDARIEEALKNHRKQGNVFSEENIKNTSAEEGYNPAHFNIGDIVIDKYRGDIYKIIESDKRGMAVLENVKTKIRHDFNAHNNAHFLLYDDIKEDKIHTHDTVETNDNLTYGSSNTLISSQKYEELRQRMRDKLNNLNSGFDPELFTIGSQMAMYHIEAGSRKFADFAYKMIEDLGDAVKPYLKSFYESARHLPDMNKFRDEMDSYQVVNSFDIYKINSSNNITNNNEQQSTRDTEIIEFETTAIEGKANSIIEESGNVGDNKQRASEIRDDIQEQTDKIDDLLTRLDKEIGNLRLSDKSYSIDGIYADYPIQVLSKTIKKDATKYVKAVADLANVDFDTNSKGKKEIVNVNIPPAGGDIFFTLWSKENPEKGVYVSFHVTPEYGTFYDNYQVKRPTNLQNNFMFDTLYRLVDKNERYKGVNQYVPADISAKELAEKIVKDLNIKNIETKSITDESLSLKGTLEDINKPEQLSIFDNVESNINDNGTEQRVLQTNNNRLPREQRAESISGTQKRQRVGKRSGVQSGEILENDGEQRQSTRRERDVLQRDAELLEPALVEYNIEDNDVESFNQSIKYDDNISAIEVLVDVLSSNRKATPAEKETLSRYVGFGGLKDIVYNPENASSWTKNNSKYKDKVSKIIDLSNKIDELTGKNTTLSDIRASILNAHYTSSTVIRAMYDGLSKLGFKGGAILEPSAGIGNFISYMPKHLQKESIVTAVELDNLTGNILKLIHDDVDTKISGIQDVLIPDNSQDLVISNIPFGNYRVYDKSFKGKKEQFLNRIHNYFFIKGLDKAREGGIVAFVTSKGVLDSPSNQNVREYLDENANFLGAVRLPNNTFKNVANTEVVTDVIFLQKNTQSKTNNEKFISVDKIDAIHKDGELQKVGINTYFYNHPENILGDIEAGGLYSRDDYTLKDNGSADNLSQVIRNILPKDIYTRAKSGAGLQANDINRTISDVKLGNLFFHDNKLYINEEGKSQEVSLNEPKDKLESYISLRDNLMDLIYSEYIGEPDHKVESLRNGLNNKYDRFITKYGKLEKSIVKIARIDADGYNVLSLENAGKKADIFSKRTISPINSNNRANNIDEAIVMSLYEYAGIDIDRIAELLDLPLEDTIKISKGKLFQDPISGEFTTREGYLSGNVKRKLKEAQQAVDNGYTEFTNNVVELEKVIPPDIPAINIEARMGSRWIPVEIYSQFARELLNSEDATITYSKSTDTYFDNGSINTVEATSKYGTRRVNGMDIIIKALMISPPQVFDTVKVDGTDKRVLNVQETSKANEKYEDIRNAFEDWIYKDSSRRDLLSSIYNEKYNTTIKRTYSGDHLNIPGINGVNLRPHQKDAIWMLLQNNGGIIDHLVGAGKTYVMIASTMEMKRTGVAKKPMIMALKSTIPQIVESYRSAYPMAKILAPTEKDFKKENRRMLFSKIANNEWDCIIMSHENYGKIPHEIDIQRKFIRDEIHELALERIELESNYASSKQIKGLETRLKNLTARLESLSDLDKDNSITFQQMGIDHIMVDESQQFKNLSYVTKQRGVAGLGKPDGSKRAFNLFMGIRYLQGKYNADKGTTFLSGTPISNSMVEMYTLLKYIRPRKLEELGMNSFDAWATTFAVPTSDIEFTVTGDFKQKTRFREFINVPELSLLYTEIADIRTDDNLKLDKPKMKGDGYTVETIQMNDEQLDFANSLMEFAKTKDGSLIGRPPLKDNEKTAAMLIATNLSSKMAIDMRLIDPSYSYDPSGKIAKTVENVYRIYNETEPFLGTQLIFSDLGTPKNTKSKSALLRDYMEDELGVNLDTLNEIFGDINTPNYKYPSITTAMKKAQEVMELSNAEVEQILEESSNSIGSFNVYNEIKYRLIEKGIPENQIVFIHDYNTQKQKEKLFEHVNNGKIRIVLGSTQKLGTGVNVQERASAIHHIDVPWTPAAMEQRNGRVLRQGNWGAKQHLNNEVPVYAYATEKTLDAYKYQLLQTKQNFLNQVKSGSIEDRVIKESDADSESGVSYAELVAMLSGNQDILLKSKLESQFDKLKRAKRNFEGQLYEAESKKEQLESKVPIIKANIQITKQSIKSLTDEIELDKDRKLIINSINGSQIKPGRDKKDKTRLDYAKKAIEIIEENASNLVQELRLDKYSIQYSLISKELFKDVSSSILLQVVADNGALYTFNYSTVPGILLNNLQKTIEDIPNILQRQESSLKKTIKDIKGYTDLIENGNTWDKQSDYDRIETELKEVIDRLKTIEDNNEVNNETIVNEDDTPIDISRDLIDISIRENENSEKDFKENLLVSDIKEHKHTKTGDVLYAAKLNFQLSRDSYSQTEKIAKSNNGKWSRYIKGFLFKDRTDAEKFKAEINDSEFRFQSSDVHFTPLAESEFNILVEKLKQTGLAVDVVLDDNIRNNPVVKNIQGDVYGYITKDAIIHLDSKRMNSNTPIHEFGHLWNLYVKENNSELYDRGVDLIKNSEYWEQVKNNPTYRDLSDDAKIDEALATAIGDKGESMNNRDLKQKFIDWMSRIWQSIKIAFGIKSNKSLADMTLSDFTDRAVRDLLSQKQLVNTSLNADNLRLQSIHDLANVTNSSMSEDVRNQLDSKIKNLRFRIHEAWADRHLAVKEFIDILRKNGVEVHDYNDYYKQATHINGKIDAQLEQYSEKFQKPLNKAIADLGKAGFDYRVIENYAILKHGLERNDWMRNNAINKYKEEHPEATQKQIDDYIGNLPEDYSGITDVQNEVGTNAQDFINEIESKENKKLVDNFWKQVKAATSYSLQKQLEGGLIDKKTFDELTKRYDYYIPLRGHDAEVAEDRWDYSPDMGTYFVSPLLKARGRKTRSESPFAYIFSMAQSSINAANRNLLNQTLLRLAHKDTTGLMGVSQSWYVMDGLNEDGIPIYNVQSANYSEDPEQHRKNIEEFEDRMQKLHEQGLAYSNSKKFDIGGLFIKRNQADQHEVHVWQNGKEYTLYINANPAVARAINGVNAKDLHKDLQFIAKVSRQMAANFTTRNPLFVLTNFSRDYIFASSILSVKENAKYAILFQSNIPKSAGALQRYIRGKADLSKVQDRYIIEYIMNGAKTGFSHILELNNIQKKIEKEIKKGNTKNILDYTVHPLLTALEGMNDFAENLSRLSVYITSREQGRSIVQSISDAKEVTVNFNRNGAGGYGSAWSRSLYLFVNAGIQALSNFAKVAQKNKVKTSIIISSYAMTGFLMPLFSSLIGGDDGLDEYMRLSDWERQNNLCIYTINGFIKIPLPQELRVFHAIGDNIYQTITGHKDTTQSLLDIIGSFADLIPTNPTGAIQGSWADIMPDATKPFFQIKANKSFTGSRITNEWADLNKPGYLRVRTNKKGESFAPAFLVKLSETLDNATGGDGVKKGVISFNPDVVNHLMRGYFGGLYNMSMQSLDIASKMYDWSKDGEFKLKIRETPLRTFYTSKNDLQTSSSGLNSIYFKIVDNVQETNRKVKGYKEKYIKGEITSEEFLKKIEEMKNDIEFNNDIEPYMKEIKKYEKVLKDLEGLEQSQAEQIITDLKEKVIGIDASR